MKEKYRTKRRPKRGEKEKRMRGATGVRVRQQAEQGKKTGTNETNVNQGCRVVCHVQIPTEASPPDRSCEANQEANRADDVTNRV
mmetsp:Transcript_13053/g.30359  ORF Transcript_13053/g.30359 Transcript_13053/m.30359 type:complete len:85 (-) Transcript_13053:37-291(-)